MDDLDMTHTASSTSRSARSAVTAGRQNSLTSPHAPNDAVLRSYNLRVSHVQMMSHQCLVHCPCTVSHRLCALLCK